MPLWFVLDVGSRSILRRRKREDTSNSMRKYIINNLNINLSTKKKKFLNKYMKKMITMLTMIEKETIHTIRITMAMKMSSSINK